MEQKRIVWMDGLKGLSCIFILLHHFIMGFYPAAYSGDYNLSHMRSQADVAFAQSPLAFFAIGDLWVSVFCMISGFVIAYQVFRMTQDGQLSKALLKRYPRLMLPVFFVSAFVFVMLQFGWFYNSQAAALTHSEWLDLFYHDKSGIIELFTDCLIDDWFVGFRTIYSNAFWMLKDLFMGSFVAYILAIMGKSLKKNLVFVYIFVCILYLSINSRMADFSFGVLLAFLFMQYGSLFGQKKKKFCSVRYWIACSSFLFRCLSCGSRTHERLSLSCGNWQFLISPAYTIPVLSQAGCLCVTFGDFYAP